MKTLVATILLLCTSAHAFNINPAQKLPRGVRYVCSDDQLPYLENALGIWNYVCDGNFRFEQVVSEGALTVFSSNANFPPGYFGVTTPLGSRAIIEVAKTGDGVPYSIMLHEMGHALGLAHSTDPEAIMFPMVGTEAYLNQDDIDGVRTIYGLSPKVFDFKLKVGRRKVKVSCDAAAEFVFSDHFVKVGKSIVHRIPPGSYTVTMYQTEHGIKCTKTFTVR